MPEMREKDTDPSLDLQLSRSVPSQSSQVVLLGFLGHLDSEHETRIGNAREEKDVEKVDRTGRNKPGIDPRILRQPF